MLTAYVRSSGFDILSRTTYNWRIREDLTSTSQQKRSLENLLDRIAVKEEAYELLRAEASSTVYDTWVARALEVDFGPFVDHALASGEMYRTVLSAAYKTFLSRASDGGDGRGPLHPEDPCLAGRPGALGRPRACRGLLPRVPDAATHRGGGRAPARGAGRLPRGRPRRDPRDEPPRDPVRRRGVPVRLEPGRPPRHHRLGPDPWPRDARARAHDRLVDLPRDRGAHRGRGHPAGPPGGDHVGEQPEHELRRERLPGHARPGRVPARRCRRRDVDPAPRRRTPGGEPPRGRPPRGPGRQRGEPVQPRAGPRWSHRRHARARPSAGLRCRRTPCGGAPRRGVIGSWSPDGGRDAGRPRGARHGGRGDQLPASPRSGRRSSPPPRGATRSACGSRPRRRRGTSAPCSPTAAPSPPSGRSRGPSR